MPKKTKTTALPAVIKTNKEISTDPVALMSAEDLKTQIAVETEKRKLIKEYIAKHLVRGTDYGQIHIAKNCPNKYNCKNEYHFSKDVLFKPGAEKFSSLFKLRAEFTKDAETWEMLGSNPGTVAYLCKLFTATGVLVGEGRGIASISEKGNANTAVKIAEKRAKMDAILATGALSDFFTQDLEDMQPDANLEVEDEAPKSPIDIDEPPPIDDKPVMTPTLSERTKIMFLAQKLGIHEDFIVEDIKEMTGLDVVESNFSQIINKLEERIKRK